jgi:glutamyl-tRNA synthetase
MFVQEGNIFLSHFLNLLHLLHMSERQVRVRFAPSPTGPLHIGGVRTALYNYLYAKKNKGTFILRIEDTDQNRFVAGAEQYIIDSLKWCGILYDEGPGMEGSYGPYRQSQRKEMYRGYADQLLNDGHAYYAFDTPEELEAMRERLKANSSQQYDSLTRMQMKNSLTLPDDEVKERIDRGDRYVIRAKVPAGETIIFTDLIRGKISVDSNQIDDKVLFKSDGWPTYHLANVVDDYLMKISHVIRGEEWLPSAPLHVLLYKFFGWSDIMPEFAHLPLLLRPDGNGKLSKRDGDRLGFPVFPVNWTDPVSGEKSTGFRERGFFAEPLINFLALLGWHPAGDKEIMTLEEMVAEFSIAHIHKAGAKFDFEKAKWFNHEYLKKMDDEKIAGLFQELLKAKSISAPSEYVLRIANLLKERCSVITEFWDNGSFFFQLPDAYDESVIKSKWNEKVRLNFDLLCNELGHHENFDPEAVDQFLHDFLQRNNLKPGDLLPVLRVALIGTKNGPSVFEIISVLGKNETVKRIQKVTAIFDKMVIV